MKKKRGSSLGRDMKKFEKIVGGSPQRMYLGESPAPPDRAALRRMEKKAAKIAEKVNAEGRMYLEAFKKCKTHAAAYMALNPDYTGKSAGQLGWREMEKIRKVISEKEIHAMLGMSEESVVSAIGRGLVSRAKKDFILPKSGVIVSTPDYDDTANQLAAASLAAKIMKMVPDDKPGVGPITVNVVSYLADPKSATPWPGGGRFIDGRIQDVVGPNSPAARAALPAGRKGFLELQEKEKGNV